jgi:hypothetical protein
VQTPREREQCTAHRPVSWLSWHQNPCVAKNVLLLAPFRRPNPRATAGEIMGRFANSAICAIPVFAARSYDQRVWSTDFCAEPCRWSDWMNRMETPACTHSARPCATKRLARFFDVNPHPDTGFSIRIFLRMALV